MSKRKHTKAADPVSSTNKKKEESNNSPSPVSVPAAAEPVSPPTPPPAAPTTTPKKPILFWKPHVHITKRPIDIVITAFFFFSFICTYFFAIQQAIGINFDYPFGYIYPPWGLIQLMTWWGKNFNPIVLLNPFHIRVIQIVNVTVFGPFFLFGTYAFIGGLNGIRTPGVIWGICNVYSLIIIIAEDYFGNYATPDPSLVLLVYYLFHLVISVTTVIRLWHPFPFGGYLCINRIRK